jgi:hypothetical protein
VWALAFNPLAPAVFASGGRDGCAYVWNAAQSEPQRVLAGHGSDVTALAWHENGLYLLSGSADGSARLWECVYGDCLRVFNAAGAGARAPPPAGEGGAGAAGLGAASFAAPAVTSLAASPGGRFFAAGDAAGAVTLGDVPSGTAVAHWPALHAGGGGSGGALHSPVHSLSFAGAGRLLLAGCTAGGGGAGGGGGGGGGGEGGEGAAAATIVYTWDVVRAVEAWEQRSGGAGGGAAAAAASPLLSALKSPGVTSFQMLQVAASQEMLLLGARL